MESAPPQMFTNWFEPIGVIAGSGPEAGVDLWVKILAVSRREQGEAYTGDSSAPLVRIISDPALGLPFDAQQGPTVLSHLQRCIDETARRRELQQAYNTEHGIIPQSVSKSIDQVRFITRVADARTEREEQERPKRGRKVAEQTSQDYRMVEPEALVKMLEEQMREAATALDFEAAARLRDQLFEVKARMADAGASRGKVAADAKVGARR